MSQLRLSYGGEPRRVPPPNNEGPRAGNTGPSGNHTFDTADYLAPTTNGKAWVQGYDNFRPVYEKLFQNKHHRLLRPLMMMAKKKRPKHPKQQAA